MTSIDTAVDTDTAGEATLLEDLNEEVNAPDAAAELLFASENPHAMVTKRNGLALRMILGASLITLVVLGLFVIQFLDRTANSTSVAATTEDAAATNSQNPDADPDATNANTQASETEQAKEDQQTNSQPETAATPQSSAEPTTVAQPTAEATAEPTTSATPGDTTNATTNGTAALDPIATAGPLSTLATAATVESLLGVESLTFDVNSFALNPEAQQFLNQAAGLLIDNPDISVEVAGFSDGVGADSWNAELSLSRANIVTEYLVALNVSADQLTPQGYGDDDPAASNDTEAGRRLNRRVELRITALEPAE